MAEYAATFGAKFKDDQTMGANFDAKINVNTGNYDELFNKPSINDVTVQGEKLGEDYHLQDKMDAATTAEIEAILYL